MVVAATDLQQLAIERRDKVQEFQRSHRVAVLTLVFTDIIGSTTLKQELGDQEAVSAIRRHHAAIREILSRFSQGEEVKQRAILFLLFSRTLRTRSSFRSSRKLGYVHWPRKPLVRSSTGLGFTSERY